AGHPQSPRAHLIERYRRTDSMTLKYEVAIDDPGAYSKPWTTSNTVRWRPGFQLMESICQEDEKDSQHMIWNAGQARQRLAMLSQRRKARKDLAHQPPPKGIQRSLRREHSNAGAVSGQIEFARL